MRALNPTLTAIATPWASWPGPWPEPRVVGQPEPDRRRHDRVAEDRVGEVVERPADRDPRATARGQRRETRRRLTGHRSDRGRLIGPSRRGRHAGMIGAAVYASSDGITSCADRADARHRGPGPPAGGPRLAAAALRHGQREEGRRSAHRAPLGRHSGSSSGSGIGDAPVEVVDERRRRRSTTSPRSSRRSGSRPAPSSLVLDGYLTRQATRSVEGTILKTPDAPSAGDMTAQLFLGSAGQRRRRELAQAKAAASLGGAIAFVAVDLLLARRPADPGRPAARAEAPPRGRPRREPSSSAGPCSSDRRSTRGSGPGAASGSGRWPTRPPTAATTRARWSPAGRPPRSPSADDPGLRRGSHRLGGPGDRRRRARQRRPGPGVRRRPVRHRERPGTRPRWRAPGRPPAGDRPRRRGHGCRRARRVHLPRHRQGERPGRPRRRGRRGRAVRRGSPPRTTPRSTRSPGDGTSG